MENGVLPPPPPLPPPLSSEHFTNGVVVPPPPPPPPPVENDPITNGVLPPPPPPPPPPAVHGAEPEQPKKKPRKWAEPIDLEKLLAKKKAEDADKNKIRFIPRKERERMAAEAKAREEAALKAEQEDLERKHDEFWATARAEKMGKVRSETNGDAHSKPKSRQQIFDEKQEELTRQRYMGTQNNTSKFSAKKKRKRTTEKKFNFDWDPEDDTTDLGNPELYDYRPVTGPSADDQGEYAAYKAELIRQRDPETGDARAAAILEQDRRAREHRDRRGFDKHWSEKSLDQMRERDWRIFKEDFKIAIKGGNVQMPMRSWEESGLPRRILEIVDQVGYKEPSAIQRAAIPIALKSRDLIGVAVTGSGKTASFLLPLLVYISELPALNEYTKNDGPYAIVLAPTRELAQQIEVEAKKFATPLGFTCVSLVGGHSIEEQAYNMRDGAEIIIATPGRLVDCIDRRLLVLGQCCYVIMDEADKMIDMGFEADVNKILSALPVSNEKPDTDLAENSNVMMKGLGGRGKYRQTMMYTATMIPAVERIARQYLRRPATVTIGNVGEAVDTVEQRVEFISGEDKRKRRLGEVLAQFPAPVIVFVNIKRMADTLMNDVRRMGYKAVTLHGSKLQDQREAALQSLRDGHASVLVATDLAGRGIDVPDVSLVVNFNMASSIETYTHRIGRTGRAGKTGVAITFLGPEDDDVLYDLKQMISKSSMSRLPDELRRHPAAQQKTIKGRKNMDEGKSGGGARG